MFTPIATFSGLSVDNLAAAKEFYEAVLGLHYVESMGGMTVTLPDGEVWLYEKPDHQAATYTALNFVVDDIDQAVDALTSKGVTFEKYEGTYQDEKMVSRGKDVGRGPNIAWFKDPAGNILSVMER